MPSTTAAFAEVKSVTAALDKASWRTIAWQTSTVSGTLALLLQDDGGARCSCTTRVFTTNMRQACDSPTQPPLFCMLPEWRKRVHESYGRAFVVISCFASFASLSLGPQHGSRAQHSPNSYCTYCAQKPMSKRNGPLTCFRHACLTLCRIFLIP